MIHEANENIIFSIIVPVYNRQIELRRALNSMTKQDFNKFEVIIIDDGSNLDIKSVVEEFDSRFIYLRLDVNSGPSVARVQGFKSARGQYIGFLDSDNEYSENALSRAHELLNLHPTVGGVAGTYLFSCSIRRLARKKTGLVTPESYSAGKYTPFDQVGFVRREVLPLWLSRDQDYFHSEFHLWLSYGLNFGHLVVDEIWGTYHESSGARNSLVFD
jgi:glycosyltransferase involved in cell wall biosynthesis